MRSAPPGRSVPSGRWFVKSTTSIAQRGKSAIGEGDKKAEKRLDAFGDSSLFSVSIQNSGRCLKKRDFFKPARTQQGDGFKSEGNEPVGGLV